MTRRLLVHADKKFIITIPDDAVVSFGPFSPPNVGKAAMEPANRWDNESKAGTLRVYDHGKKNILACFAHVRSFRDLSIGYEEEVTKLEGESVWKSDDKGYYKKSEQKVEKTWSDPMLAAPEEEPDPFA